MIDLEKQREDLADKEPLRTLDEGERTKISALNYIELSLANPSFGDARRDELALAALKTSLGRSRRSK